MAGKTSKKSAKVAKKVTAKRPSLVKEKPAATKSKGVIGEGEPYTATKRKVGSASKLIARRIKELGEGRHSIEYAR